MRAHVAMAPCCPAGQRIEYYIDAENTLTIDTGALWAGPAVLQVVRSAASIELQLMTSDGRSVCHVGALRHDACAGELCQRRVRWTRRLPRRSASTRRLPMEISVKVRCTTESVPTTTMRVPAVMWSTIATRPMDEALSKSRSASTGRAHIGAMHVTSRVSASLSCRPMNSCTSCFEGPVMTALCAVGVNCLKALSARRSPAIE